MDLLRGPSHLFSYFLQHKLLSKQVERIFSNINLLPLSISKISKRGVQVFQVRTKWEDNSMLTLSEANNVPYHPNEFQSILENFSKSFPKMNSISDRLMIHW